MNPPGQQLELFAPPAARTPDATPDAHWRTVETASHSIRFVLKRSRRRTIGLTIRDTGLQVTAPHWARLADIDRAVASRSRWIQNRLSERQLYLDQQATTDKVWCFGGKIPYMGQLIELQHAASAPQTGLTGHARAPVHGDRLLLQLPPAASSERIQDAAHAWLQGQARWWLDQRLQHFLGMAGQTIESWQLSSATTRWGSCSSARRIRLNWRLIHFDHALIDYVVAHEVAHLVEMNHSPAFWKVVQGLLPGYEAARRELRRYRPGVMPFIADS